MATVVEPGKSIRLESEPGPERRREWREWKAKGYRVLDRDGVTVWQEKEAIRRLVLEGLGDVDADVFLFGSRAGSAPRERSDYDVGFWAEPAPKASALCRLREVLEELPIPGHVELVDFGEVSAEFREMVLRGKEVEIWKRRQHNSIFSSRS